MIARPDRGFTLDEFENRTTRAQAEMKALGMDALLLTTEPNVRYFTGFLTQFWESPTRPWFCVIPADGKPIAVIPEIGAAGMRTTWVEDIRTWPAPRPEDDGISLLAQTIKECMKGGKIGIQMGHESHLRMPAGNFQSLCDQIRPHEIADATMMMRALRNVKSEQEVAKIHYACDITSTCFENLPNLLKAGESERDNCKRMRIDLLERGADHSPYLISASGQGGYDNIIMGPTDRILERGDILIIDTGTVYDGYFCDFDRNYGFGEVADESKRAYETVFKSTDAGFAVARPGATYSDIWKAMWDVLEAGGALGNDVGRMGHGLGIQLTEGPSVTPDDHTVLKPGMVVTLEPGMEFSPGKQMVHEENILITEDAPIWLTRRAPAEIPIVEID
ncbi:M24 family metallopeptidase [Curvivirga sp.]|uniref:M24 family metallopeptidase n=1 Tax=Curvivirga sp. TaxID=2856848 RepID=UPI003B5AA33C